MWEDFASTVATTRNYHSTGCPKSSSSLNVGSPGSAAARELFLGLAGPGRTDLDPSFSCSPTEMPSGCCEWLPRQRPGDLQPAGTKVTPPQCFTLSLPSFHQPAGELFILSNSSAQIHHSKKKKKKLHTQVADIITYEKQIKVPTWATTVDNL